MRKLNLMGYRTGKLVVLSQAVGRSPIGSLLWNVRCDCGAEKTMSAQHIRHGMHKYPSCGCLFREIQSIRSRKTYGEAAKWMYFLDVRTGARKRGYSFDLTLEQFLKLTGGNCSYCGREPYSQWPKSKRKDGTEKCYGYYLHNGIDRIDNEIGYVLDNCTTACKTCNRAKFTLTVSEFKDWIKMVYVHLGLRSDSVKGSLEKCQ